MDGKDSRGGVQVIEAYGDCRFRISSKVYESSVIVLLEETHAWPAASIGDASEQDFVSLVNAAATVEILLLGCGTESENVPSFLAKLCRDAEIFVETMNTGAAARTYNLLASEGRRVAAALIAVE
jgi:uncharacterized protein